MSENIPVAGDKRTDDEEREVTKQIPTVQVQEDFEEDKELNTHYVLGYN